MSNGKTILKQLMSGTIPRTRLFALNTSLYGLNYIDKGISEYFSHEDLFVTGQLRLAEKLQQDIAFSPFVFAKIIEAFGVSIKHKKDYPPHISGSISAFEAKKRFLSPPDEQHKNYRYFFKAMEVMKQKFDPNTILLAPLFSPVEMCGFMLGIETWVDIVLFEPAQANELLELAADHIAFWLETIAAIGFDGVVLTMGMVNKKIFTEKVIVNQFLPILMRLFSKSPVPLIVHSTGQKMEESVYLYTDLPNVLAWVPNHNDSFEKINENLPEGVLPFQTINGPTLDRLTITAIEGQYKLLEKKGGDTYWSFATSGADIPLSTREENLIKISELCRTPYG